MFKGLLQILIQKHLAGKATKEETEFVEAYDRMFDNESPVIRKTEADENEIYAWIRERIDQAPSRPVWRRWQPYAAAVAVVVVGWWTWTNHAVTFKDNGKQTTLPRTLIVQKGKVSHLMLSDGTEVVLSGGSRLTYPDTFGQGTRTVHLEGQAYFKVAKRIDCPFVVKTRDVDVRVLGTSFNLRSYRKLTEVSVETGIVSVKPVHQNTAADELILHAKEKVVYDSKADALKRTDAKAVVWQHSTLDFKNRSLEEIKPILESRYGIRMVISPALLTCKIYTKITDEPAEETLSALAETINASFFLIEEGTYGLSGEGCSSMNQ